MRNPKTERKGLWEVRFILSGVPLPKNKVVVNDKLRFERLSTEEENLRLPTRALIKTIGTSFQVKGIAERYLRDFIGLYSNIVRYAIRIIRDDGADELPSEFVPPGTKSLDRVSPTITLYVKSEPSKTKLKKSLKLADKVMNSVDLDSKAKSFLRLALDYLLNSKSVEEKRDKLINCMIGIEALFGEKNELKYRISHRVACLLAKDDKTREEIFTTMKNLYDKRSDIVHGRRTVLSWNDIKKGRSYLSDSIDHFLGLSQTYSRDKILQTLDNAVVNSRKREELQVESEKLIKKTIEDID